MAEPPLLAPRESASRGPAGSAGPLRWRSLRRPELGADVLASYQRERLTQLAFPVAVGLMEGGFVGVIADKVYHVHPALLALISAAPMFGNLSSFLWARLAQGRRKVPFILALQAAIVGLVLSVAWLPAGRAGAWLLIGSLVATRVLLGGIVAVRSLVWTVNYPREARARVTARLTILTMLTITATSLLGGFFLDANPGSFRTLYAIGAALAGLGVIFFSKVRVTGEQDHLALERGGSGAGAASSPPLERRLWRVLRNDPVYARYLSWQFLLGVSNMMIEAPIVYLVSRELDASYTVSIAMTLAIPLGLAMLTMPLWAAYIDRVHISEFRARHSWFFVASQLCTWIGALRGSLLLIGLGRVILGTARGGGTLAWQLGHNDFAEPRHAGLYMGVHVTLTGLRGAFAPFLGILLYVGWSPVPIPGLGLALPAFAGLGGHVLGIAAACSTTATFGFIALHRRLSRAASA